MNKAAMVIDQTSDANKLRVLADWFDAYDDARAYIGVRDVQTDLRRIANEIESSGDTER